MKYLTVKNYKEIESAKNAVINRVNEAQKRDRFNNYGTEHFLIFDKDLVEEIKAKDGVQFSESYKNSNIPKNKSANVNIIDVWSCGFYYDARDGHNGITEGLHFYLVSYKGMLFDYSFYYSKTTADFCLFNDSTNYAQIPEREKPKRMGTITDKGIEAWYQYLIGRKNEADAKNNSSDKKWADLQEKVRNFAMKNGMETDGKGTKNCCLINDYEMSVYLNGIHVEFHYNKRSGYIDKKMSIFTYDYDLDFFELFAKLSDNGLGK